MAGINRAIRRRANKLLNEVNSETRKKKRMPKNKLNEYHLQSTIKMSKKYTAHAASLLMEKYKIEPKNKPFIYQMVQKSIEARAKGESEAFLIIGITKAKKCNMSPEQFLSFMDDVQKVSHHLVMFSEQLALRKEGKAIEPKNENQKKEKARLQKIHEQLEKRLLNNLTKFIMVSKKNQN